MNIKNSIKPLATVAGVFLTVGLTVDVFAKPAQAVGFNFSYSGSGVTASGVLTTTNTFDANGFLTITGITGQRNGSTITALLSPGSFPNTAPNDNLFSPASPFLTFNGFSYLVGTQPENVFALNGGYAETSDINANTVNDRILSSFNISAQRTSVPEPFTIIGTLIGGTAAFRMRKKLKAYSK